MVSFVVFLVVYVQLIYRMARQKEDYLVARLIVSSCGLPVAGLLVSIHYTSYDKEPFSLVVMLAVIGCLLYFFVTAVRGLLSFPTSKTD